MSEDSRFRIISVTGAHSGVGKTTLCSILLKHLDGFGAIKFTKSSVYSSISDSPETIRQEGKDTAIMSEAGAEKVVWIKSPASDLEHALDIAMGKMTGCKGVIVEGNSPSDYLNPDLVIFIIGSKGEIKPSAEKILQKANIIVFNGRKSNEPIKPPFTMNKRQEVFEIDLDKKSGEVSAFLSSVEKRLHKELH
jgi:molybdopterin-guanine dinucleotide biosynthesis protein